VSRIRDVGTLSPWSKVTLTVTFVVLYLPLATVVALSFNESPYGTLPFRFSTRWYVELMANDGLVTATFLSFQLGAAVAITSAIIGTTLAVWLVRHAKRFAIPVTGLLVSAITIPWLILGVAMLTVANAAGLGRGLTTLFLGSLATSMPYMVLIVVARLREIEPSYEEAARSLGARPLTVLWRIVVPMALPAIAGGALMAFMVCFNNFTIQYFLSPFGVRTLPLEIYTLVRVGYRPDINALATFVTLFTVTLVVLLQWLGAGTRRMVQRKDDS
jgi:ABC-type spermidine/putrescine transport system permease subunit II